MTYDVRGNHQKYMFDRRDRETGLFLCQREGERPMVWIWGAAGYIAGTAVTLLAMIVMMGRSERHHERYYATNICENCPWDR